MSETIKNTPGLVEKTDSIACVLRQRAKEEYKTDLDVGSSYIAAAILVVGNQKVATSKSQEEER